MIGGPRINSGRKPDPVKDAIAEKFHLSPRQRRDLTPKLIEQLNRCQSDEARCLILGVRDFMNEAL